jgi:adenylate cyclase
VRYVLEGSVRKLGDVVRVNAQLISTADGEHVWSDRFDESMNELAEGQNVIVNRIGSALRVELIDLESARSLRERPDNPDDFDLILQANSLLNKPRSERRFDQAQALLEQVLQRWQRGRICSGRNDAGRRPSSPSNGSARQTRTAPDFI